MGGCGTSHDVTERGALQSLRFSRRRWPWTCTEEAPEARSAGGGYSDALVAAIETQAAAKVADVSSTAAIEAVAGMLSRGFGDAEVVGEGWVQDVVTPFWLMQVGRSLVREGASLSVLNMGGTGAMELTPAAFYNFEALETPGAEREADWHCRVTTYGPSSYTRLLARDRLVFVRWGTSPGTRYRGQGPTSWAHLTARLQGEAERSLADEAAGPLAQIVPIPQDPGDDDDPLAQLRADIAAARGKAVLTETTSAGWGEGQGSSPHKDWVANRLGPNMPTAMVELADAAFSRMVAACGASVSLFTDSDGTAQREALRRWHMGTVHPLARPLANELTLRLDTKVILKFDGYPMDLQARASTFKALVAGGGAVNEALATSGLLSDDG